MIAYIEHSVSDTAWNWGELARFISVAPYDILSPNLEMVNQGTERNYFAKAEIFLEPRQMGSRVCAWLSPRLLHTPLYTLSPKRPLLL